MSWEQDWHLLFKKNRFEAYGDDAAYFRKVQDERILGEQREQLGRYDDQIIFVGHTAVAGEEPVVAFRV